MLQTAAYNAMEKLVRCFARGEFCDKNTPRIFRCVGAKRPCRYPIPSKEGYL